MSEQPEKTDAEVLDNVREISRQLQRTSRWHRDNDRLLRAWADACREMSLRGLTDDITNGVSPPRPD